MKKSPLTGTGLPENTVWLLSISAVCFIAQLVTGLNYPKFREEFYYIDCAKHLSFGYVDQPPFSIFVLAMWKSAFGGCVKIIAHMNTFGIINEIHPSL